MTCSDSGCKLGGACRRGLALFELQRHCHRVNGSRDAYRALDCLARHLMRSQFLLVRGHAQTAAITADTASEISSKSILSIP